MRFKITSTEIAVKSGTAKATGRPYEIREQVASCELNGEVRRVILVLDRDQQAYGPGVYELDPASFYVNQFGQLNLRPRLRPVAADVRKAG